MKQECQESIHCLPHDVIREIFLLCRPFPGDIDAEMSPDHPSVVLSHVCSSWREAALGVPLLWANIVDTELESYPSKSELEVQQCNYILDEATVQQIHKRDVQEWIQGVKWRIASWKAWISRSAARPLTIAFTCHLSQEVADQGGLPSEAESVFMEYIDTVCSSSTRWKAADICIVASALIPSLCAIARLSPKCLPLLEELTLRMIFRNYEALYQFDDARIFRAPSLHSLRLYGMREMWDGLSENHVDTINWSNLKSLSLLGYHDDDWAWNRWDGELEKIFGSSQALTILRRCPNLVSCSLALDDPEDDNSDSDSSSQHSSGFDPLPLLSLQSLSVEGISSHGKFSPKSFQLPSLQTLSLLRSTAQYESRKLDPATIEESYFEWIEHLGDQLTDVSLDCFSFSPETLHKVLHHLPNVTRLELSATFFAITHTILVHLTKPIDSEPLCPKLESIKMSLDSEEFWVRECDCLRCMTVPFLDPIDGDQSSACERAVVDFLEARRGLGSSGYNRDSSFARIKSATVWCDFKKTINIWKELEDRGVEMHGWKLFVGYRPGMNEEKKKRDYYHLSTHCSALLPL